MKTEISELKHYAGMALRLRRIRAGSPAERAAAAEMEVYLGRYKPSARVKALFLSSCKSGPSRLEKTRAKAAFAASARIHR